MLSLFLRVYTKTTNGGGASVNAAAFWADFADFLAAFATKRLHSALEL